MASEGSCTSANFVSCCDSGCSASHNKSVNKPASATLGSVEHCRGSLYDAGFSKRKSHCRPKAAISHIPTCTRLSVPQIRYISAVLEHAEKFAIVASYIRKVHRMPVTPPPDRNEPGDSSGQLSRIRVSMREAPTRPPETQPAQTRRLRRPDTMWMAAVLFFCLVAAYSFGRTRVSWVKQYPFFAKTPAPSLNLTPIPMKR